MFTPKFRVALRGEAILTNPRFNKGTAFTKEERKAFGLTGKLPYRVNSLDEQCQRAYDQLQAQDTNIGKNSFLQSMKEQNWVLYYTLLTRNLRELVPIIYTPTEASLMIWEVVSILLSNLFLFSRQRQSPTTLISSEGAKGST